MLFIACQIHGLIKRLWPEMVRWIAGGGRVRHLLSAVAIACSLIIVSPAYAGKNDDAWAKCLWEKVPTSTNNWLGLPLPPKWQSPGAIQPEYALQNRLQAACNNHLIPQGKKSAPSFNAKSVRAALIATKPPVISGDFIDPKAYLCRRFFTNDKDMKNPAGFRWGFGDDTSKAQFGSMSLIFAAQGGGSVGLPETGGLEQCSWIQADGSLINA